MPAPRVAVARRARTGRPTPVGQEDERGQGMGRLEWGCLGSVEGMKPLDAVRFATPDGCHIALVAQKGNKQLVVLNGQAGPEFDFVYGLIFSAWPTSRRGAARSRRGMKNASYNGGYGKVPA